MRVSAAHPSLPCSRGTTQGGRNSGIAGTFSPTPGAGAVARCRICGSGRTRDLRRGWPGVGSWARDPSRDRLEPRPARGGGRRVGAGDLVRRLARRRVGVRGARGGRWLPRRRGGRQAAARPAAGRARLRGGAHAGDRRARYRGRVGERGQHVSGRLQRAGVARRARRCAGCRRPLARGRRARSARAGAISRTAASSSSPARPAPPRSARGRSSGRCNGHLACRAPSGASPAPTTPARTPATRSRPPHGWPTTRRPRPAR